MVPLASINAFISQHFFHNYSVRHPVTLVTQLFRWYSLQSNIHPVMIAKRFVTSGTKSDRNSRRWDVDLFKWQHCCPSLQSGWELSSSRLCRRCFVHMECELWNAGETASWHAQVTFILLEVYILLSCLCSLPCKNFFFYIKHLNQVM